MGDYTAVAIASLVVQLALLMVYLTALRKALNIARRI